jgi:uncharacterized protein
LLKPVASFNDSLNSPELAALLQMQPEILLIGSGTQKMQIPPSQLARLAAQNMGIEVMDTAAACRTYNVLASENRKVAAILLLHQDSEQKP